MPLQTSGQISLQDLHNEFGGGLNLMNYYRGGSYVPDIAANAGISTSGFISLYMFYGAAKYVSPTVAMPNTSDYGYSSTGTATARLTLNSSGSFQSGSSGTWLTAGSASDVEVYVSRSATIGTSGTFDTWLNLGTSRTWSLSTNVNGNRYTLLSLTFRRASDGVQLDTASVDLSVERGTPV